MRGFNKGVKDAKRDIIDGWIYVELGSTAEDVKTHLKLAIGANDSYIDGYIQTLETSGFFE